MAIKGAASVGLPADPAGTASSLVGAHVAANDPHGSRTTLPIDSRTGNQTLAATDRGHVLTSGDASGVTYTVPANVCATGDVLYIRQGGTGTVTVAAGASASPAPGVTVTQTAGQGALISIHFQSATTYTIDGNAV
jgi:hypothetical protein